MCDHLESGDREPRGEVAEGGTELVSGYERRSPGSELDVANLVVERGRRVRVSR